MQEPELEQRAQKAVAKLVANVYRSFEATHPRRADDVIRFTLQCTLAMFAQDIGLLPRERFTRLLYQSAKHADASARLAELFGLMRTRGLIGEPVNLPVDSTQLAALIEAAEANWTVVDPHILGAVFQGIMGDDERHATGAYYTGRDDIMRVVGPTIVEPWRRCLDAATTLGELQAVWSELRNFRVLDPACGSGNFLYVAFTEIYALETALLARMQEFPSVLDSPRARAGIPTTNFHGIDINPFAVELARATLNIAKKIAFDERRRLEQGATDPPLSLDNLERNIVCADALFIDWPPVDAIIGNPPILGDRKIRAELGEAYLDRLKAVSGVDGVVDLSCYWFRRAHDHLPPGGRAGLVGTSGLRVGKAREASLDYLVARGGTITNAVSSMLWLGDAALDVCMVNWVNGTAVGPHQLIVDGHLHTRSRIPTHLALHADVSGATKLHANKLGTAMGVIFGSEAFTSDAEGFPLDERGSEFIRPLAAGTAMLTGTLVREPKFCIYLVNCETEREAAIIGKTAFRYLQRHVYPMVQARAHSGEHTEHYQRWLATWWQPHWPRSDFFTMLKAKRRMIACANPQARPIFEFLSTEFVPTNTMQVFAFDDDYSFGIIQSSLHWAWLKAKGGKLRSAGFRYTSDVWKTFPWPQHPSEQIVANVAAAALAFRATRASLMASNGWSLRTLYQAAGPHPLEYAQKELDESVAAAYELPADQDPLEFLLARNLALADREAQGQHVCGPGLPPGFDANDPRWSSDDCLAPPALA
jgi:SAM-dependent methyltransferase